MPLRVRFQYPPGASLGYSIERLSDGLLWDFDNAEFAASPAAPVANLVEGTGGYAGLYRATLNPTPAAKFRDGGYGVYVHDTADDHLVIRALGVAMHDGDDQPAIRLASAGLDAVGVEAGINARQALALVMDAAGSGVLSGAETSTVTVKNPAGNATRIVAICDAKGNRSAVTLTPPA